MLIRSTHAGRSAHLGQSHKVCHKNSKENLGTAKHYLEHTKKILENVSKKMKSIVTGLEKEINDSVQSSINLIKAQIEQRKVDMEKAN
ncbi:hypothetical protein KCU67_g11830, partial [Aureobasidium melanogenum]